MSGAALVAGSLAARPLASGSLAAAGSITPPSIEYSQLAPMFVVFGAALAGVLVEAFTPRPARRVTHLVLALSSLTAAFVWTIVIAGTHKIFASGSAGHVAAMGAVAVDRPTLFIQATILVLALVSVMLLADSSISPFAAQAAAPPGSAEEREGVAAGFMHTEIFPLTLFAIGGMMLFLPAALGVYMMTNSMLGITQQIVLNRFFGPKEPPQKGEIVVKQAGEPALGKVKARV